MTADILIVDDEQDIRNLIQGILDDEGYKTRTAANSSAAYASVEERIPDLIILDIWLQGSEHDGIQILETIRGKYPNMPILMISGHGTIETAVSAIKQGAYDFIEKPFKSDRLLLMIKRALETASLRVENDALRKKLDAEIKLIGSCSTTQNFVQMLKRAAPTNSRILLTGEAGSGKEIAARFIHGHSTRQARPFLALSCANLRPERLETELFGSEEAGSGEPIYTGTLEKADGGTLFLDEVADMPLETQGKIVRVLQNQVFNRVGGNKDIEVDVRVIASTNKNLKEAISRGEFREDLFYRLSVVPIQVPSLRERLADVPEIIDYLTETLSKSFGVNKPEFSNEAIRVLKNYKWPGNIRQLKNTVEWVMIIHGDNNKEPYGIDCLPNEITGKSPNKDGDKNGLDLGGSIDSFVELPLRDARESFERSYLSQQIERFEGNISKTAKFVGMERSALHRKLKTLGIVASDKDGDADDVNETQDLKKRA